MDICYSPTLTNPSLSNNGNRVSGTIVGRTLMFMAFAGTILVTNSAPLTPEVTICASNTSSVSCIDYVSLKYDEEIPYLSNNLFYDLRQVENLKKLDHMATFEANWDGYGAGVFSREALDLFRSIIMHISKQPDIAPTGRNSLLLQYETVDNSILAFEVGIEQVEMVLVPQGDYSLASSLVFEDDFIQQINGQVKKFYGLE